MKYALIIGCIISMWGCHASSSSSAADSLPEAPTATGLERIYEIAREANNIRSVLISLDGKLVMEQYFDAYSSDSLDHQRSGTKSIMASLIGIAIDQGMIKDVEEPLSNYLIDVDDRFDNITIRHLLTMTSGFEWNEEISVEEYNTWVSSGDQLGFLLRKPTIHAPGTKWNYNSATMHLLSMVLTRASGMSTLAFAEQYLFAPLHIQAVEWERLSGGFYNGGAGLQLRPKDMIKLGKLIVDDGMYEGKQIISKAFIDAAISHQEPTPFASDENIGYGYGWWLGEPNGVQAILARGYAGQIIAVFPELQMVAAITHNWRVDVEEAIAQQGQAFSILATLLTEDITTFN